jgi:hypothetical protein
MAQSVYSPKDVDISFGGQVNIDGWDSITLSRNSENTAKNISADGRLGLTYSADMTGAFDIEVQQQNSAANTFFAELQRSQDQAQKPVFYNITITDKSGGMLAELQGAFLDMPSSQDLSAEAGSRTWMFYVERIAYLSDPSGYETTANSGSVSNAKEAVEGLKDTITNAVIGVAVGAVLDILN